MAEAEDGEQKLLRSVALQNANAILLARQRAEEELLGAREALERKTEDLAQSLALMQATLESSTDGILVTDGVGRIKAFNSKFVEMWQIPPDLMDKGQHADLVQFNRRHFIRPQQLLDRISEIYTSSPQESYDTLDLTDGRTIERVSRTQLVDKNAVGRVWNFRDITERQRSDKARAHLAAIVESSDDAIISKTLDGIIVTWNQGAERIFGYQHDEVIGKPVAILIPPDRTNEETKILTQLKQGKRIDHYETVRMRKDGTRVDVSLMVSPIRDASGRVVGASKIARDITERAKAAEEKEHLLAAERAARRDAEHANLLKDEFLANISHELRTPLNAILGWVQLLARMNRNEELNEGLQIIARSARSQSQLIEDLLDMNRITSGKMRLEMQETNLAKVVEAALDAVRPSAESKGILLRKTFHTSQSRMTGDPNRLQQIVWNLLSNAVKFTPKGGTVDVFLERLDSHWEIAVKDSGIGMTPELLPYVFERFRQGDSSTSRKYGGLGLGLAIVKQLVELHGGTVDVKSAGSNQGSTFVVSLPVAPVHDAQERVRLVTSSSAVIQSDGIDLADVKVLVVEDDPDVRELIKRVLTNYNGRVIICGNATEALQKLRTEKPDVLVSDIGMPEMDGYAFIREVRRLPAAEGGKIPGIALTAFARSEDRTRAMLAGYQIHIAKPIEPQELLATVASFAGRALKDYP